MPLYTLWLCPKSHFDFLLPRGGSEPKLLNIIRVISMFCTVLRTESEHLLCGHPIQAALLVLPVRLSVCPVRAPNSKTKQESRAVARKPRDAAAVLFDLKFADNIHQNFKSSQVSKAMLQSSKHTGAKQNLTQNGHSRSFKVTCFGVSGKAIRD